MGVGRAAVRPLLQQPFYRYYYSLLSTPIPPNLAHILHCSSTAALSRLHTPTMT